MSARIKVSDLMTLKDVERELDACLATLRQLTLGENLQARTATEYRIGRLRIRKAVLENLPKGAVPSGSFMRRFEIQAQAKGL